MTIDTITLHIEWKAATRAAAIFAKLPAAFSSEDADEHMHLQKDREIAVMVAEAWRVRTDRLWAEYMAATAHDAVREAEEGDAPYTINWCRSMLVKWESKLAELEAA